MTRPLSEHLIESSNTQSQLYDCKILIADDFNLCRKLLHECFSSYGFKNIYEAVDGQDTIEKVDKIQPDLLLLDMNMPRKTGLEVCEYIRKNHSTDDIAIIMQTGLTKDSIRTTAFKTGVTDFVSKPVEVMEVIPRSIAHLERLLYKRGIQQQYEYISKDLEQARCMQRILLPDADTLTQIREEYGLDISFHFQPANELAGDYISVRALDDGRIALISADVSGHGIASALYAFSINALLSNEFMEHQTPADILNELNKGLCLTELYTMHSTMFLALIDPKTRTLSYAAAAAPAPIVIAGGKSHSIDTKGYLLGLDHAASYTTHALQLASHDIVFICSDALYETRDANDALISEEEAYEIIHASRHSNAAGITENITASFNQRCQPRLTDDLSLLTCKFL